MDPLVILDFGFSILDYQSIHKASLAR